MWAYPNNLIILSVKRSKLLKHIITWINSIDIMLSERKISQKIIYSIFQ